MKKVVCPFFRGRDAVLLSLLYLFHAFHNLVYLVREHLPPHIDPAYHFTLSIEYYRVLAEDGLAGLARWHQVSGYYPPFFHALVSLLYWVLPIREDVACGINLLFLGVLIAGTYALGRALFDRRAGLVAAVLVTCYPMPMGMARVLYSDFALLALVTAASALAVACDGFRRRGPALGLGIVCGIGLLTKWTFAFFLAVPLAVAGWRALAPRVVRRDVPADRRAAGLYFALGCGLVLLAAAHLCMRGTLPWMGGPFTPAAVRTYAWIVAVTALVTAVGAVAVAVALAGAGLYLAGRALEWPREGKWSPVVVCAAAAALALLPASWWYGPRILPLARDIALNAYPGGRPVERTVWTGLEYLWFLEHGQTHFIGALLFLWGAAWALIRWARVRDGRGMYLLVCMVVPYAIFSGMSLRNPRFTMPLLGAVAVLSAGAVFALARDRLRKAVAGFAVGWSLFYALCLTYGFPLLPPYVAVPLKIEDVWEGPIAVWNMDNVGGPGDWDVRWPLLDIVRDADRAAQAPPERPEAVGLLAYHGHFHYEAFNAYAKSRGLSVIFRNATEVPGDVASVGGFRFLVSKNGDPGWGAERFAVAVSQLADATGELGGRYVPLRVYALPDGATATLWQRRD